MKIRFKLVVNAKFVPMMTSPLKAQYNKITIQEFIEYPSIERIEEEAQDWLERNGHFTIEGFYVEKKYMFGDE